MQTKTKNKSKKAELKEALRKQRVNELFGILAKTKTSSKSFAKRKREEIAIENRNRKS